MTSPSSLIADLEDAIADAGEPVIVRRYTAPTGDPRPKIDRPTGATVRPLKAEELVGNIDQTWSRVILSPTLVADLLPLQKGDKVVIQGKERNVEFPQPIALQGEIVRIELLVRG